MDDDVERKRLVATMNEKQQEEFSQMEASFQRVHLLSLKIQEKKKEAVAERVSPPVWEKPQQKTAGEQTWEETRQSSLDKNVAEVRQLMSQKQLPAATVVPPDTGPILIYFLDLDDTITPNHHEDYNYDSPEWKDTMKKLDDLWFGIAQKMCALTSSVVAIVTNGNHHRIHNSLGYLYPKTWCFLVDEERAGRQIYRVSARSQFKTAVESLLPSVSPDQQIVMCKQFAMTDIFDEIADKLRMSPSVTAINGPHEMPRHECHVIGIGDSAVELLALRNAVRLLPSRKFTILSTSYVKLANNPSVPLLVAQSQLMLESFDRFGLGKRAGSNLYVVYSPNSCLSHRYVSFAGGGNNGLGFGAPPRPPVSSPQTVISKLIEDPSNPLDSSLIDKYIALVNHQPPKPIVKWVPRVIPNESVPPLTLYRFSLFCGHDRFEQHMCQARAWFIHWWEPYDSRPLCLILAYWRCDP